MVICGVFRVQLQVLEGRTRGQAVEGVVEESRHLLELLRRREFQVETSEEKHELVEGYLRTVVAGQHFLDETAELLVGGVWGSAGCSPEFDVAFFHNIIIVLRNECRGGKISREGLVARLSWDARAEQALRDSLDPAQSLGLAVAELLAEPTLILIECSH